MRNTTDVVEATQVAQSTGRADRRHRLAQAALEVLEEEGGRGLTHRAVDRQAGLPEGSTSNYFPTRVALLEAALHRLVELEGPAVRAMEDLLPGAPYSPREAAELTAELVERMLTPGGAQLATARYELYMEARRRPEFQAAFNEVRREFLLLTERLLPAVGCSSPADHAPELLAAFDGLMVNQLFQPATALRRAEMIDYLERFFASC
jgi:DNA-binding transcriptional regulator YbjK